MKAKIRETRLFHLNTPITAQSFDIRADYAEKYGPDPGAQKQEQRTKGTELTTIHAGGYYGDMSEIDKAQMVATWFHRHDTDMAGEPYINHCARVAANVQGWCVLRGVDHRTTDQAIAVAWMHDVLEDTDCTFTDLQLMNFSYSVLEGVVAMTQRREEGGPYEEAHHGVSYEDLETYWARVKKNRLAHIVKMKGDIPDNNDEARMERGNMPQERRAKLHAKYARAVAFLGQPTP